MEIRQQGSQLRGTGMRVQCSSRCKEAEHNARTCKKAVESSDLTALTIL